MVMTHLKVDTYITVFYNAMPMGDVLPPSSGESPSFLWCHIPENIIFKVCAMRTSDLQ